MVKSSEIHEHMEVLGSDGEHVGTVDHMDGGDRIKLTKNDPKAGGKHHFIKLEWADHVDMQVHLKQSSADAMKQWQTAA